MKKKFKKILIMGLPGSGKTTLARKVSNHMNLCWLNADRIRKKFNDWDFSKQGRVRQAKRLNSLANNLVKKNHVVVDFVCPTHHSFKYFKADKIIWVDTIKKSRFNNMNLIFKKPKKFDLRVTSKDANLWSILVKDLIKGYKWNNKKETAQLMGRFQPWHKGHRFLFDKILKKVGQVNIQIKDMKKNNKNLFSFKKTKEFIKRDLFYFSRRIKITLVPNISNIFYGRKVGYKITKIKTPKNIENISATKIRKKFFSVHKSSQLSY